MARDANFAFLAKQMLLTELHGATSDRPGGIYVDGESLWLGIWDPDAAGDPEILVKSALEQAQAAGKPLGGVVVLAPAGELSGAEFDALADALYVYGYPRAGSGVPDSVMVLGNTPRSKPVTGLRIDVLRVAELAQPALGSTRELMGPAWGQPHSLEGISLHGAWFGDRLVAAAGMYASGLVDRMALLHNADPQGDHAPTLALLESIAHASQAAGRLVQCAWADRHGLLRFLLAEAGYSEQLSAAYFLPE